MDGALEDQRSSLVFVIEPHYVFSLGSSNLVLRVNRENPGNEVGVCHPLYVYNSLFQQTLCQWNTRAGIYFMLACI